MGLSRVVAAVSCRSLSEDCMHMLENFPPLFFHCLLHVRAQRLWVTNLAGLLHTVCLSLISVTVIEYHDLKEFVTIAYSCSPAFKG